MSVFFSKPRISLHWFVPMLSAKQHSHKRSRTCFGWRQIDLKESSKKTFFGVGMLCQTQFTPHWMLMQREHVSGLFSNHLYVPSQLSPEATSALTFCWALGTVGLLPKGSDYCILNGHNVTIWPELFLLNVVPNWYLETLLLQVDVISAFCIVIHLLNDSTVWCAKTACTYRYVNLQPSQDRS